MNEGDVRCRQWNDLLTTALHEIRTAGAPRNAQIVAEDFASDIRILLDRHFIPEEGMLPAAIREVGEKTLNTLPKNKQEWSEAEVPVAIRIFYTMHQQAVFVRKIMEAAKGYNAGRDATVRKVEASEEFTTYGKFLTMSRVAAEELLPKMNGSIDGMKWIQQMQHYAHHSGTYTFMTHSTKKKEGEEHHSFMVTKKSIELPGKRVMHKNAEGRSALSILVEGFPTLDVVALGCTDKNLHGKLAPLVAKTIWMSSPTTTEHARSPVFDTAAIAENIPLK